MGCGFAGFWDGRGGAGAGRQGVEGCGGIGFSFASSSVLATQIVNGAPFDVFLAADFSFPEKVVASGLAVEKTPVPYAQGTLVLWARKDSPIQPLNMEKINDKRVTKIAIADQFHAPYGAAAYSALTWMKELEKVKPKLVVAENIAQTAQFVVSGNAQVGFLSLTSASSPQMKEIGTYVLVPFIYPKIMQCAVVMKNSPKKDEAVAFLAWMGSPEVQGHLKDFGLHAVE
jgi:molybdate transport system substrate-binding protein